MRAQAHVGWEACSGGAGAAKGALDVIVPWISKTLLAALLSPEWTVTLERGDPLTEDSLVDLCLSLMLLLLPAMSTLFTPSPTEANCL